MRTPCEFIAVCMVWLALVGSVAARAPARLAGAVVGDSVLSAVAIYGAPGLVATTDDGLEWRWFDARGLDVDILADNSLVVREIVARRPQAVRGVASKLVQPAEFPLLEAPVATASAWMKSSGAVRQSEPENAVMAWRVGGDVVVLELQEGIVRKVRALDAATAAHLGYIAGPQPPPYRAPRLLRQHAVDYPRRALEQRAEGEVVVEVDLLSDGGVKDGRVLVSSGNADIDAAELLSMRRSTFEPARCGGVPCEGVYLDREEYSLAP